MSNKTRKRIWPVSLVTALGVVAMLAVLAVAALTPEAAQAQAPVAGPANLQATVDSASEISLSWSPGLGQTSYELERKAGNDPAFSSVSATIAGASTSYTDTGLMEGTQYTYRVRGVNSVGPSPWSNEVMATTQTVPPPVTGPAATIVSSSTTGGASVKLTLTIESPGALVAGSSVVLYLEDDFQVPDDIDPRDVYFVGTGTGRVYVVDEIEIEDDDHFNGDDDWDIQVFLPDRRPDNDAGYDDWSSTQSANLQLIFTTSAGIKNPTEEGSHSAHYAVLAPGASVPTLDNPNADARNLVDLPTLAKISLSDEDTGRGKEVTVTGTGFNNGTGAEVFVYVSETEPTCGMVIANGESLGTAEVGSDDKFVVTFTVEKDPFEAGGDNYLCAVDSEAGNPRMASAVKPFTLEASVTVDPTSANFGEEITIKARDFGGQLDEIDLGPRHKWLASEMNDDQDGCKDAYEAGVDRNADNNQSPSIIVCVKEIDGDDYIFDVPGDLGEQIQISAERGSTRKTTNLSVVPSSLELSQTEVAPNQSIIISGSGFTEDARIYTDMITMDGTPLDVSPAGTQTDIAGNDFIQVTSNGEFTATVRIWTADDGGDNPALDDDEYTIKAVDTNSFEGETKITIKEPTVSVMPETASPRDFIVISGENWPISTADDDNYVTIMVDNRTRNADIDGNGRFRYEYQLRSTISIGDEHDVVVMFAFDGDVDAMEEEATFNTVEAELGLDPGAAAPGQTITVSVEGMPPYSLVEHVKIDGADRLGGRNINTNREGDATVADILIPFLDPGFYPVEVKVGNETRVAQLEVLPEAAVTGVAATLPDAVSDLGDNLDAIFHFNNQSKEWTFYDPRPEFADLNTLTELHGGQPYWVLVKDTQEDVDWNGRLVSFTCAGGDCWNLEIW